MSLNPPLSDSFFPLRHSNELFILKGTGVSFEI